MPIFKLVAAVLILDGICQDLVMDDTIALATDAWQLNDIVTISNRISGKPKFEMVFTIIIESDGLNYCNNKINFTTL